MFRSAHGRTSLSAVLAFALSVAVFALFPMGRASAAPAGVTAGLTDEEVPARPDGSEETRDDDDVDDDEFVRTTALWTSAAPSACERRHEARRDSSRRGHRSVLERPPRA